MSGEALFELTAGCPLCKDDYKIPNGEFAVPLPDDFPANAGLFSWLMLVWSGESDVIKPSAVR